MKCISKLRHDKLFGHWKFINHQRIWKSKKGMWDRAEGRELKGCKIDQGIVYLYQLFHNVCIYYVVKHTNKYWGKRYIDINLLQNIPLLWVHLSNNLSNAYFGVIRMSLKQKFWTQAIFLFIYHLLFIWDGGRAKKSKGKEMRKGIKMWIYMYHLYTMNGNIT